MATNIILNFYDTVANLPVNVKTIEKFHKFIAESFNISENDVKELSINYSNNSEKTIIKSTPDLLRCIFYFKSMNDSILKYIINIEISAESRLFNEIKSSNLEFSTYSKMLVENKKNEMDLLKAEIEKKEEELKLILEKEKLERENLERVKKEKEIQKIIKETEERNAKLKEQLELEKELIMKDVEREKIMLEERKKKQEKIDKGKDKEESMEIIKDKKEKKQSKDKKEKKESKEKKDKKESKEKIKKEKKEEVKEVKKAEKVEKKLTVEEELSNAVKQMKVKIEKVVEKVIQKKENEIKEKSTKSKAIHPGVKCDSCNKAIIGIRYKCTVCEDFDFCEECEEKNHNKHNHLFIKIRTAQTAPIKIIIDENIVPKKEENDDIFEVLTKEMKGYFNLTGFSDKQIYNALKSAKGNFDEALGLLFKF